MQPLKVVGDAGLCDGADQPKVRAFSRRVVGEWLFRYRDILFGPIPCLVIAPGHYAIEKEGENHSLPYHDAYWLLGVA